MIYFVLVESGISLFSGTFLSYSCSFTLYKEHWISIRLFQLFYLKVSSEVWFFLKSRKLEVMRPPLRSEGTFIYFWFLVNMKATSIVIGDLRTVSKNLEKILSELEIRERIEAIQTTALLKPA